MVQVTPPPAVPNAPIVQAGGYSPYVWLLFFDKLVKFIATLTQRGTRADQPLATSVYPGTLYYVTDEHVTEKSTGTVWQDYTDHGLSAPAVLTISVGAPTLGTDDTAGFWRDGATPESLWLRVRRSGVFDDIPIFTWP